jgi:pimeloyl-ACP methyl ester carboxylesterase
LIKATKLRLLACVLFGGLIWAAIALFGAQMLRDARTAVVDGHQLTFPILGNGHPAVVMISGLGDGMATFDDVAADLGKATTVIIYDRAGYGGSERASGPRDALAAERELSGLLAQSGVAGPFVLSGHSLGGLFAEYYAAKHPEQVAGLILEDSRPADFTRRCMASIGDGCLPPPWTVWFIPQGARDEAAAFASVMDQVEGLAPMQGKPVLVLSQPNKDADQNSFGALWTKAQSDLAARYPGSRHLIAKSGGHYLHYDQREWFVASVQAFLGEIR